MDVVERNRSEIMAELHKMYASQGIGNYAARLGELLCLLVNIEVRKNERNKKLYLVL